MNVTIEESTSAFRYLGSTRLCDTSVYTVHASIAINPKENMLYNVLHCDDVSCILYSLRGELSFRVRMKSALIIRGPI